MYRIYVDSKLYKVVNTHEEIQQTVGSLSEGSVLDAVVSSDLVANLEALSLGGIGGDEFEKGASWAAESLWQRLFPYNPNADTLTDMVNNTATLLMLSEASKDKK